VLEFPSSCLRLSFRWGLLPQRGPATRKMLRLPLRSGPTPSVPKLLIGYSRSTIREAVLLGTLSPKRRDNPDAIRDYMVNAFKALPDHKVSFGDQLIRVYGDMAINSGYYTFTYSKDGESKSLPARYTFVYAKRNGQWMIVDHHSSATRRSSIR